MYIILKDSSRHTEEFFIAEQPCRTVKTMRENNRDLSRVGAAGAERCDVLPHISSNQSNLDDMADRFIVLQEVAETGLRKLDEAGLKDRLAHGLGDEDPDVYKVGGTE